MWFRSTRLARRPPPARRIQFRPRVEALEDRTTPSGGGLLDPTFNGTGTEALPNATCNGAYAVAVQPDGKIVSVGDGVGKNNPAIQVVRLNPDGSLDTTFNGTGTVTLTAGSSSYGMAVALQPDGKILVGGSAMVKLGNLTDAEYVVARLTADGSLDKAFGNSRGMWLSNPTAGREEVHKLAVLTDAANHVTGVMAGGIGNVGGRQSFAAVKLTAAGLPDATFGAGGTALANAGGVNDNPHGMAVTPAGGVVLVGTAGQAGAVVALTPSGQLDTTFNGTGSRVDNISGAAFTYFDAVAVQPAVGGGYRVVVAGTAYVTDPNRSGLVIGYTSGGQFDPTFGTGGLFITAAAGEFTDVALEADGSIVVAGYAWYTGTDGQVHQQMAVGHLTADGAADPTFGTAGTGISLVPPLAMNVGDAATSLAIGADGRITVAGVADGNYQTRQAVFARFTAP